MATSIEGTVLNPIGNIEPSPAPVPARRTWSRWVLRTLFVYVVLPYVGVCAILTIFQRSMIYVPTREAALRAEDAGLEAGRVRDLSIRTDDDLELHGWLVRPAGLRDDAEIQWVVLYFHGNAGNRLRRVRDCTDFTDVGVDVILFDYRGYGDNPGRPSEEPIARDARRVWNLATGELGVPADRILLYGESLGGGVAIRLAAELWEEGTPPAGLIVSSTFTSLPDAAAHRFWWLPVRWLLWERYSSVDRIGRVTCLFVQFHGEADEIVPIALGRGLFEASPERSASGVPKRFVEVRHGGHNDISKSEFAAEVRRLTME